MKNVTRVFRAMCRRWIAGMHAVVAACLLLPGCGSHRTPPPVQSIDAQAPETRPADERSRDGGLAAEPRSASNGSDQASPDTLAGTNNAPVDRSQLATVGPQDARRGSTITGGGIITEPAKQYFSIQHRIVFMNLQHAEQLYKATHGRMPQSHDEYMKDIIDANEIELPELQPGWDYYYDAEREELMRRKTS